MMSKDQPERLPVDGAGIKVGLVAARYNFELVNELLASCMEALRDSGVAADSMEVVRVPGSNEIPQAVAMLVQNELCDVVIGLGLVIKGDTDHAMVIGLSTAHELQRLASEEDVPIINGILTVNTEEQARERILGGQARGREFAHAALEMAEVDDHLKQRALEEFGELTPQEEDFLDRLLEDGEEEDDDDLPNPWR